MQLRTIAADAYARDVLPLTAELWAGGRDLQTYAAQVTEMAVSAYGKKFYQTLGLFDGRDLLSSCKRYERTMHLGTQKVNAVGIGAVFTPEAKRGAGYATAMLAMLLDASRAAGADVAYLFSDIHPAFYAQLGFKECPSRSISLRADSLPSARVAVANIQTSDWAGIRRSYDIGEHQRAWGFVRSPVVWSLLRLRMRQRAGSAEGESVNLVVRSGKHVLAYVMGRRDVRHDALIVDEYGFPDLEGRGRIGALIRNAAGDMRRIVGWLPPEGARQVLPRGSVRKRKDAILMMAPLTPIGGRLIERATWPAASDGVWSTDHI